ncbi:hypothetical protein FKP32DRAFT_1753776 [Trametes sanguinea]|nr:hypothetical protein FKP32DRAFT_1753776 [Trametes sanguinea]
MILVCECRSGVQAFQSFSGSSLSLASALLKVSRTAFLCHRPGTSSQQTPKALTIRFINDRRIANIGDWAVVVIVQGTVILNTAANAVLVFVDTNSRYTRAADTGILDLVSQEGMTDAWVKHARNGSPPAAGATALLCPDGVPTNISCETVDKVFFRGSKLFDLDSTDFFYDTDRFLSPNKSLLTDHKPAPYWAFGFPAAILSVFGADFVFATGTLFVAKACLPHKQSVSGVLFQTLTQVGTAFGIALSTIVFDATLVRSSLATYGVRVGRTGAAADAPRGELVAYKDAMWTGCAFGFAGALLAGVFLRSVGVVGHREKREEDAASEVTAADRGEAAEART